MFGKVGGGGAPTVQYRAAATSHFDILGTYGAAEGGAYFTFSCYEGLYLKYRLDIHPKISPSVPNRNSSVCTPAGAYSDLIRYGQLFLWTVLLV